MSCVIRLTPRLEAGEAKKKLGSFNDHLGNHSITFPVRCSYHLAIDGRSFQLVYEHFPEVLDRLATRGAVFARMSPEQKQILVEHLQQIGYYVGKSD